MALWHFFLKKSLKYLVISLTCSSSFVATSSESTNSVFLGSFLLTVVSALNIFVA